MNVSQPDLHDTPHSIEYVYLTADQNACCHIYELETKEETPPRKRSLLAAGDMGTELLAPVLVIGDSGEPLLDSGRVRVPQERVDVPPGVRVLRRHGLVNNPQVVVFDVG